MQRQVITGVGVDDIFRMNGMHSAEFNTPEARALRREYRKSHPTEFMVFKCMDGRLHLAVMTKTPLGLIQPFRNLGGVFDAGWHFLQELIMDSYDYAERNLRHIVLVVTWHKSKGCKHRGCAGHKYKDEAAQAQAHVFKRQLEKVFCDDPRVTILVWGIETDHESILLYREDGTEVNLADETDRTAGHAYALLRDAYPKMAESVIKDLVPLVMGNIAYSQDIQASNRPPEDADHMEWVLGIGRGFDWLHAINTALIVGPFARDLSNPIRVAAGLISDNIIKGRISNRKPVLMASAPYRHQGYKHRLAIEKSRGLLNYSLDVVRSLDREIKERDGAGAFQLEEHLSLLSAVVDVNTRELEVIDRVDR